MDLIYGPYLTLTLQHLPGWLTLPMQIVSLFGLAEIYILLIPAIYWCYDTRLGVRLALITACNGWFNDILKMFFHMPRPYWISNEVKMWNLHNTISFGFPSGHAEIPISFLGMVGYWLRSLRIWLFIAVFVLVIGISRIYLGVHFSLDILIGWVIGLGVLIAAIFLDKPVTTLVSRLSGRIIILSGLAISLILTGMSYLVSFINSEFQIPSDWIGIEHTAHLTRILFTLETTLLTAGFFFGTIAGWTVSRKRILLLTEGTIRKKGLRYVLGMIGVGLIWVILGIGINLLSSPASDVLLWIRGAGLGVWIFYAAPWLFLNTGLSQGEKLREK